MTDQDDRSKSKPSNGDAEVLALAESLVGMLGKTYDRDGLETLRGVVDSYPTVARAGAGEVAASLVGLLDDLIARQQIDKEALAVHVRAWRFMASGKPDGPQRAQLLDGLRLVRELYQEPKAA